MRQNKDITPVSRLCVVLPMVLAGLTTVDARSERSPLPALALPDTNLYIENVANISDNSNSLQTMNFTGNSVDSNVTSLSYNVTQRELTPTTFDGSDVNKYNFTKWAQSRTTINGSGVDISISNAKDTQRDSLTYLKDVALADVKVDSADYLQNHFQSRMRKYRAQLRERKNQINFFHRLQEMMGS